MHLTHPRHEWRKRTDDRHKTGYDNCLASILLIELMGLVEMALLEYSGIGIIEEPLPEENALSCSCKSRPIPRQQTISKPAH